MANIRVTCPTCKQELEIDERYDGQEVECGSCLQVFVARGPNSKAPPAPAAARKPYKARRDPDEDEEPRRKKPRRREDDDDDFDYDERPARPPAGAAAVATLVLGIMAFVLSCCFPASILLGVVTQITGGFAMRGEGGRGMAIAGMVLGGIGLLVGLGFAAYFIGFAR